MCAREWQCVCVFERRQRVSGRARRASGSVCVSVFFYYRTTETLELTAHIMWLDLDWKDNGSKKGRIALQPSHTARQVRGSEYRDFGFDTRIVTALVPMFRETEIESYFGAFERIAVALHWPKDMWAIIAHISFGQCRVPILLQCKLTGKAQEVCAFLSTEDSLVYETVKSAISSSL